MFTLPGGAYVPMETSCGSDRPNAIRARGIVGNCCDEPLVDRAISGSNFSQRVCPAVGTL